MSYTSDLQNNNVDLQAILDKVNKLPSSKLPELNNPADSSKILEGYESVDDKGNLLVGSMPNQGSKSATLGFGEEFTIEEGYYDGTGKVTSSGLPELSNPASAENIDSGYEVVDGDGNLLTGTSTKVQLPTLNNAANASQILSGYEAIDSSGIKVTGSMPDNTTKTSNGTVPGINSNFPNIPTREGDNLQYCVDTNGEARISMAPPAGYYQGGGGSYINRPADEFGSAVSGDVLSGKTFTSSSGLAITGSIGSKAAQTYTPGTSDQKIAAGQYLSGTQTIKGDANLKAANIKSGVSIFGVRGSASSFTTMHVDHKTTGSIGIISKSSSIKYYDYDVDITSGSVILYVIDTDGRRNQVTLTFS